MTPEGHKTVRHFSRSMILVSASERYIHDHVYQ